MMRNPFKAGTLRSRLFWILADGRRHTIDNLVLGSLHTTPTVANRRRLGSTLRSIRARVPLSYDRLWGYKMQILPEGEGVI